MGRPVQRDHRVRTVRGPPAATPPAPGDALGDLVIADAEITQVIQHFRSHTHLNSANVFPGNSIRLVAEKPMAVRLYADYDMNSGLAPIGHLSGELQVTPNGTTTTPHPASHHSAASRQRHRSGSA